MKPSLAHLITLALFLLLLAFPLACGAPDGPADPAGAGDATPRGEGAISAGAGDAATVRPSFVIWMVDTLRADALGCYGRPRAFTPQLDAFAGQAVLYEQVAAPASYTRASIASLLTGLPASLHGTRTRKDALRPDLPLLVERLRAAGYSTAAVVANPNVGSSFGFNRGWDRFIELYKRRESGPVSPRELISLGPEVAQHALAWLSARSQDRPFFLFILSIDPHGPYTPPKRYAALHGAHNPSVMDGRIETLLRFDRAPETLTPDLLTRMKQLYAGEVSLTDEAFGVFLDGLASRGLAERTVVAFTSDHGEEFYEHGHRGHGRTVFEESVRIPLVVRDPFQRRAGERDLVPRSLLDLTASILVRAGVSPLPGSWGVDLEETERPGDTPIVTEQLQDGALVAVRAGRYKVVRDRVTGVEQVFNLQEDPEELLLLPPGHPEGRRVSRLLKATLARLAEGRPEVAVTVDEEEIPDEDLEALRALGYVR